MQRCGAELLLSSFPSLLLVTPNLKSRLETLPMERVSCVGICFVDSYFQKHSQLHRSSKLYRFGFCVFTLPSKRAPGRVFRCPTAISNRVWALVWKLYCDFVLCNLAVLQLFYKDPWTSERWFSVQSPGVLSVLWQAWRLAGCTWDVMWSCCVTELTKITLSPPVAVGSDASTRIVQ